MKEPSRKYETAGNYPVMLISTTDQGCVDTAFKVLYVSDDFSIYIPNSFTPNDDGINDYFGVKGTGIQVGGFLMELFDRTGHLMFTTKDINEFWNGRKDGNKVQDGSYMYKIKLIGMNGEGRRDFIGYFNVLK